MNSSVVIDLLEFVSKFVPKRSINRLVISPHSRKIVEMYESLPKPNQPKIYRIANDVSMGVNLSYAGERAISFNAFEPIVTRKFLKIVKCDDVVIDVGAWIGYYSLLAASKVGPKGRIISIEPHVTNIERIKSNIQLNGFKNIDLLNLAVADKFGIGALKEGDDSLTHTIVTHESGHQVKTDTLDNIVRARRLENVNVLIMDIEGYEYFALRGAEGALKEGIIKNIICEVHPNKLSLHKYMDTDVLGYLRNYGFKIDRLTSFRNCYHIHASR